jgi:DNA-binding GntR family transcriptional regulator
MVDDESKLSHLRPSPSLKDQAFESIREAILGGRLKPGILYKEQGIAGELGISKTPVREALLELAGRGFVTSFPRKGFEINSLTAKNIHDLFELRLVLETAVMRHITADISKEALKQLEAILARDRQAVRNDDQRQILQVNRELHSYLAALTGNEYLIRSLQNIQDLIEWLIAGTLRYRGRAGKAYSEHLNIFNMLKKRDVHGAAAAMTEHLSITEREILSGRRSL